MNIFNKNVKTKNAELIQNEDISKANEINERPRICCIDIEKDVEESLKASGFNIYSGSLGNKIKIPNNSRGEYHQVLLDYNFPLRCCPDLR